MAKSNSSVKRTLLPAQEGSDKKLLKKVSKQADFLTLLVKEAEEFKTQVCPADSELLPDEEEEEVSLKELEEVVTAMHTATVSRMPTDDLFMSRLRALHADAARALAEDNND